MFFIRYDYKDGERAREREDDRARERRKLHRRFHRGCHITITITLPEGFIHHQLQLIRLLLRLATRDLYLDIYSFIHLWTSLSASSVCVVRACGGVPCFIYMS